MEVVEPPDLGEAGEAGGLDVLGSEDLERPSRRSLRSSAAVRSLLWVVLAAGSLTFLHNQVRWFAPFVRSLASWLVHPSVAGDPSFPARWGFGLLVCAATAVLGYGIAFAATSWTDLHDVAVARVGISLVVGPALLGFMATLADVVGELTPAFLLGELVTALVITAVLAGRAWLMAQRPRGEAASNFNPRAGCQRHRCGSDYALWSLVGLAVALILIHVAMSPVIEWDAIVYHAGVAKLWYLGRPSPPLSYGPSVGIQISGNYPPLFPASGAFFDILLGRFDDFYLRVIPPFVFLGLLLSTYAYTHARFGKSVAKWSVLLLLGCPIMVLYAEWPTNYIYLTSLTALVVFFADYAARTGTFVGWLWTGLFAGLDNLTSFYGLLSVGVGLIAYLVLGRPQGVRGLTKPVLFIFASLVIVAPWYLRNLVLLGDPVYPLASPPFRAAGLVASLWRASESEIRNNALGYWVFRPPGHVPLGLRMREAWTALWDRHLLGVGNGFAFAGGVWLARRASRGVVFLLLTATLLIVVQLIPGWYWLRALLPAIPACTILAALAIVELSKSTAIQGLRRGLRITALRARSALLASIATGAVCVAVSLVTIGPDTPQWATDVAPNANLMQATSDLGSTPATLDYVFGGDYQAWTWLNGHLGAENRVATLDNRLYYYRSPSVLFYLDGLEAAPLLRIRSSKGALDFLRKHRVQYVFAPAWSYAPTPTRHPLVAELPLFSHLGHRDFPLVKIFAGANVNVPDEIFHVGPLRSRGNAAIPPALFPGQAVPTPLPPRFRDPVAISANDDTPRLFLVAPAHRGSYALSFEFRQAGAGTFSVNQYAYRTRAWIDGVFSRRHDHSIGWQSGLVPLFLGINQAIVDVGVHAAGAQADMRHLGVIRIVRPYFSFGGAARTTGHVSVRPRTTNPRLVIPVGGGATARISLWIRSIGRGSVDINELNPYSGRWIYTVAEAKVGRSSAWSELRFPVATLGQGFVDLGIYVTGHRVELRNPSVMRRAGSLVSKSAVPN